MVAKISVIIPIYNCEKYLEKSIDSVVNQTLKDIEIILVNDGSTDNSGDICDRYSRKYTNIKVIYQENKGAAAARNAGMKIAIGEYIGFIDSDDIISNNMYEILYENSKGNIDIIQCNYKESDRFNNTEKNICSGFNNIDIIDKKYIEENIIPSFASNKNRGYYPLWNKIYRKEWIDENNITIDEKLEIAEDWWFNIICFTKANSIKFVEEVLYEYIHQNDESLMYKYRKNQFELQIICRNRIVRLLSDYNITKYEKEFNVRFLYSLTSNIFNEFKNNKKFFYRKYKKIFKNNLIAIAAVDYNEINNVTKIAWKLVSLKMYCMSYVMFKMLYIIYNIKNIFRRKK